MISVALPLLVLAGGFGTRLKSVVSDVPKPLAPIGQSPFLRYLMDVWIRQGIQNFVFLLHHEAEKIADFAESYKKRFAPYIQIDCIVESSALGTGGSVANAVRERNLSKDFLVVNADTWLSGGIAEIISKMPPAIAIIEVENSDRYGQVKFTGDMITEFVEKKNSSGKSWINAGLYHLDASLFSDWNGESFSLETHLFPQLVKAKKLKICPIVADFTDIGIPDDYDKFIRYAHENKLSAP